MEEGGLLNRPLPTSFREPAPGLDELRLRSAHGRLIQAAWRVPSARRLSPTAGGGPSPAALLAHLLEYQGQALARMAGLSPVFRLTDCESIPEYAGEREWRELVTALEEGQRELLLRLERSNPPWLAELTYVHYKRHLPALLAVRSTKGTFRAE